MDAKLNFTEAKLKATIADYDRVELFNKFDLWNAVNALYEPFINTNLALETNQAVSNYFIDILNNDFEKLYEIFPREKSEAVEKIFKRENIDEALDVIPVVVSAWYRMFAESENAKMPLINKIIDREMPSGEIKFPLIPLEQYTHLKKLEEWHPIIGSNTIGEKAKFLQGMKKFYEVIPETTRKKYFENHPFPKTYGYTENKQGVYATTFYFISDKLFISDFSSSSDFVDSQKGVFEKKKLDAGNNFIDYLNAVEYNPSKKDFDVSVPDDTDLIEATIERFREYASVLETPHTTEKVDVYGHISVTAAISKAFAMNSFLETEDKTGVFIALDFDRKSKITALVPVHELMLAIGQVSQSKYTEKIFAYDTESQYLIIYGSTYQRFNNIAFIKCEVGETASYQRFNIAQFVSSEVNNLYREYDRKGEKLDWHLYNKDYFLGDKAKEKELERLLAQIEEKPEAVVIEKPAEKVEAFSIYTDIPAASKDDEEQEYFELLGTVQDFVRSYIDKEPKRGDYTYVYSAEELFWKYNIDHSTGKGIKIEELLAYFVSKGKKKEYIKLSQKILGLDYSEHLDMLQEALVNRGLLALDYVDETKMGLKYIHEYLSGNVYDKIRLIEDDSDLAKAIIKKYGEEDGKIIVDRQKSQLEDAKPELYRVNVDEDEEKRLKLNLTINHPVILELPIITYRTKDEEKDENIKVAFLDYLNNDVDEAELANTTKKDIENYYINPLATSSLKSLIRNEWLADEKQKEVRAKKAKKEYKAKTLPVLIKAELKKAERDMAKKNPAYIPKKITDKEVMEVLEERLNKTFYSRKNFANSEGDRLFDLFLQEKLDNVYRLMIESNWNRRYNANLSMDIHKAPFFCEHAMYHKIVKGVHEKFIYRQEQIGGIKFYISRGNAGLFAHDVGFGKTTSSLGVMNHLFLTGEVDRLLAIVPLGVYDSWMAATIGNNRKILGLYRDTNIVEINNNSPTYLLKAKEFSNPNELQIIHAYEKFHKAIKNKVKIKVDWNLGTHSGGFEIFDKAAAEKSFKDFTDLLSKVFPNYKKIPLLKELEDQVTRKRERMEFTIERREEQQARIDKDPSQKKSKENPDGLEEFTSEERIKYKQEYNRDLSDLVHITYLKMFRDYGKFPKKKNTLYLATYQAFRKNGIKTGNIELMKECATQISDNEYYGNAPDSLHRFISDIDYYNQYDIEELDVDGIMIDEVHNFNKLYTGISTRLITDGKKQTVADQIIPYIIKRATGDPDLQPFEKKKIKYKKFYMGFDITEKGSTSFTNFNIYCVVRSVQRANKEKRKKPNSLMLSATPFSNSPFEMLSVCALVNTDKLFEINYGSPFDFFVNFVREAYMLDTNYKLQLEYRATLDKYINHSALGVFIRNFYDFRYSTTDECAEINNKNKTASILRPCKIIIPDRDDRFIEGTGLEKGVVSYVPLTKEQETIINMIFDYVDEKRIAIYPISYVDENLENKTETFAEKDEAEARIAELKAQDLISDVKMGEYIIRPMKWSDIMPTEEEEKQDTAKAFVALHYIKRASISPYLFDAKVKGVDLPILSAATKKRNPQAFREDAKNFVMNSPKLLYVAKCCKSVIDYQMEQARNLGLNEEEAKKEVSGQIIYFPIREFTYLGFTIDALELLKEFMVYYLGLEDNEVEILKGGMKGSRMSEDDMDKASILKERFNSGEVKILIGTQAIQEGIDLQDNSSALYVVIPEYNPADQIQLEGRLWRQGNIYKYVRIINVLAYGSVDMFIFATLQEKTKRLKELLATQGFMIDASLTRLDIQQVKLELIRNPKKKAKLIVEKEREVFTQELQATISQIGIYNQLTSGWDKVKADYEQLISYINVIGKHWEEYDKGRPDIIKKHVYREYNISSNFDDVYKDGKKIDRGLLFEYYERGLEDLKKRGFGTKVGMVSLAAATADKIYDTIKTQELGNFRERVIKDEVALLKKEWKDKEKIAREEFKKEKEALKEKRKEEKELQKELAIKERAAAKTAGKKYVPKDVEVLEEKEPEFTFAIPTDEELMPEATTRAEEKMQTMTFEPKLTRGEFAVWLLKKIGINKNDYVNLWSKFERTVYMGWDKERSMESLNYYEILKQYNKSIVAQGKTIAQVGELLDVFEHRREELREKIDSLDTTREAELIAEAERVLEEAKKGGADDIDTQVARFSKMNYYLQKKTRTAD